MSKRLVLPVVIALATWLPVSGDSVKDLLKVVPQDAAGFLLIPNIATLENDLKGAITALELQDMVPLEMISAKGMLKQYLGIADGLNDDGPLAVALMLPKNADGTDAPHQGGMDVMPVIIVPSTDPNGLLQGLNGEAGADGAWTVMLNGMPLHARVVEQRIILAMTPDAAGQAAEDKTGIGSKLSAADLKALENLDVALWLNAERLFKHFKDMINGFTGMMMMMQGGADPVSGAQAQNLKQSIDMLVDGAKSLTIGIGLDKTGLGLRGAVTSLPGSELAKQMKTVKMTDQSLLDGLPACQYLAVIGQDFHEDYSTEAIKQIGPMFDSLALEVSDANKKHLGKVRESMEQMIKMGRGMRATIAQLSGKNGLIGAVVLADVTDSGKFVDLMGDVVTTVKGMDPEDDDDVKEALANLAYKKDAETIDGAKVSHLSFDLAKMDDIDEEDIEDIHSVIGSEGITLRIAAVDGDTVALTLGGGKSWTEEVVKAAKSGAAPLASSAGVKKVASRIPAKKSAVGYIAVDQVISCIRAIQKTVDEEQLPIDMGTLNAPAVFVAAGTAEWSQADMFVPTELMIAIKKFTMAMMGMNKPEPAASAN